MRIGIIGAMKSEVSLLKEEMKIERQEHIAGMDFFSGQLGSHEVVVVQSGIGKVNAAICAQILIDDFQVTYIINTGVAGSLNKDLDIGDIVVSVDAVQHDFTVEAIGFKKGEIPFLGKDPEGKPFAAACFYDKAPDEQDLNGLRQLLRQAKWQPERVILFCESEMDEKTRKGLEELRFWEKFLLR